MPRAILLNSAEADLTDIWEYIAQDSTDNATSFVRRLQSLCESKQAYTERDTPIFSCLNKPVEACLEDLG